MKILNNTKDTYIINWSPDHDGNHSHHKPSSRGRKTKSTMN